MEPWTEECEEEEEYEFGIVFLTQKTLIYYEYIARHVTTPPTPTGAGVRNDNVIFWHILYKTHVFHVDCANNDRFEHSYLFHSLATMYY